MKKQSDANFRVFHSDSFKEVLNHLEKEGKSSFPYPFDEKLLTLLKAENKFEQEYFYIENGQDYAFFIVYKMKMDIFTFGKLKCLINMNVIGYPCSLSEQGYITNNEELMLGYIEKMKGAKLILNVRKPSLTRHFTVGETLPTCMFYNSFHTPKDYLNSLRSAYRRRIQLAINKCRKIRVQELEDETGNIHKLYLNTYNKSDYKLEKLESGFFETVDAVKLGFMEEEKIRGFVLLKMVEDKLIFMLCGMDYTQETADLYYYMLYTIICYGIERKCKVIDLGQTSEETKMKLGAVLEKRYFYAHHSNKVLNAAVNVGKGLLEYKYQFPEFHVFKTE